MVRDGFKEVYKDIIRPVLDTSVGEHQWYLDSCRFKYLPNGQSLLISRAHLGAGKSLYALVVICRALDALIYFNGLAISRETMSSLLEQLSVKDSQDLDMGDSYMATSVPYAPYVTDPTAYVTLVLLPKEVCYTSAKDARLHRLVSPSVVKNIYESRNCAPVLPALTQAETDRLNNEGDGLPSPVWPMYYKKASRMSQGSGDLGDTQSMSSRTSNDSTPARVVLVGTWLNGSVTGASERINRLPVPASPIGRQQTETSSTGILTDDDDDDDDVGRFFNGEPQTDARIAFGLGPPTRSASVLVDDIAQHRAAYVSMLSSTNAQLQYITLRRLSERVSIAELSDLVVDVCRYRTDAPFIEKDPFFYQFCMFRHTFVDTDVAMHLPAIQRIMDCIGRSAGDVACKMYTIVGLATATLSQYIVSSEDTSEGTAQERIEGEATGTPAPTEPPRKKKRGRPPKHEEFAHDVEMLQGLQPLQGGAIIEQDETLRRMFIVMSQSFSLLEWQFLLESIHPLPKMRVNVSGLARLLANRYVLNVDLTLTDGQCLIYHTDPSLKEGEQFLAWLVNDQNRFGRWEVLTFSKTLASTLAVLGRTVIRKLLGAIDESLLLKEVMATTPVARLVVHWFRGQCLSLQTELLKNQRVLAADFLARVQSVSPKPGDPGHPRMNTTRGWCLFKNFAVNVDTGGVYQIPHSLYMSREIPYEYPDQLSPLAGDCDEVLRFLLPIFPSVFEMHHFLRMLGKAVGNYITQEVILYLVGDASTGKSSLQELVQEMLGIQYAQVVHGSALREDNDSGTNSARMRLQHLNVALFNESSISKNMSEDVIKMLSGGDTQACRGLYQDYVMFKTMALMMMISNNPILLIGASNALYRRLHCLYLCNKFDPGYVDNGDARNPVDVLVDQLKDSFLGDVTHPERLPETVAEVKALYHVNKAYPCDIGFKQQEVKERLSRQLLRVVLIYCHIYKEALCPPTKYMYLKLEEYDQQDPLTRFIKRYIIIVPKSAPSCLPNEGLRGESLTVLQLAYHAYQLACFSEANPSIIGADHCIDETRVLALRFRPKGFRTECTNHQTGMVFTTQVRPYHIRVEHVQTAYIDIPYDEGAVAAAAQAVTEGCADVILNLPVLRAEYPCIQRELECIEPIRWDTAPAQDVGSKTRWSMQYANVFSEQLRRSAARIFPLPPGDETRVPPAETRNYMIRLAERHMPGNMQFGDHVMPATPHVPTTSVSNAEQTNSTSRRESGLGTTESRVTETASETPSSNVPTEVPTNPQPTTSIAETPAAAAHTEALRLRASEKTYQRGLANVRSFVKHMTTSGAPRTLFMMVMNATDDKAQQLELL